MHAVSENGVILENCFSIGAGGCRRRGVVSPGSRPPRQFGQSSLIAPDVRGTARRPVDDSTSSVVRLAALLASNSRRRQRVCDTFDGSACPEVGDAFATQRATVSTGGAQPGRAGIADGAHLRHCAWPTPGPTGVDVAPC